MIVVKDSGLRFNVSQAVLSHFEPGDKIGWSSTEDDHWLATVTVSEPDPAGWHLAWYRDHDPQNLYHWRGPNQRDSRWTLIDPSVIHELP